MFSHPKLASETLGLYTGQHGNGKYSLDKYSSSRLWMAAEATSFCKKGSLSCKRWSFLLPFKLFAIFFLVFVINFFDTLMYNNVWQYNFRRKTTLDKHYCTWVSKKLLTKTKKKMTKSLSTNAFFGRIGVNIKLHPITHLGKLEPSKTRPLKIKLETENEKEAVMSRLSNLKNAEDRIKFV